MPMPCYRVVCYQPGCGQDAAYKIAARWSDGLTEELKTYAVVCPGCLASWFQLSREKQKKCRRAPGEVLEPPGIYELVRGQPDQRLNRRPDLEREVPGE
jgi:hypothetical protein